MYQYTEDHPTRGPASCDDPLLRNQLVRGNPYKVTIVNGAVVVAAPVIEINYNGIAAGADFEVNGTVYFVERIENVVHFVGIG